MKESLFTFTNSIQFNNDINLWHQSNGYFDCNGIGFFVLGLFSLKNYKRLELL